MCNFELTDDFKCIFQGITLVDVNCTAAEEALQNIENIFGRNKVIFFKADVTKTDEVDAAFKKTLEQFGNIDIVINSAGILDDVHWEKEVAVNVVSTKFSLNFRSK